MKTSRRFKAFGLVLVASFLATIFLAKPSFAADSSAPAGSSDCALEFRAEGRDIQILLGYSRLKGVGRIVCVYNNGPRAGESVESKMKATIGTPILFPRISFAPSLVVHGRAKNIRILKGGPSVLFGDYLTLDFRAAAGSGVGAMLTLEGQENGVSIDLDLENVEGFGIAAGGTRVSFQAP